MTTTLGQPGLVFFWKDLFYFNCACVGGEACTHGCMCLRKPEKGIRLPRAGVIDTCGLRVMGDRNQMVL